MARPPRPRWFDDPEAFRPERWDNDLIKRLPRCAYFPFGDGPRICIGNHFAMMEAVLILATIAQRYRLEVEPGQTLELLPSITLRPRRPIQMRLRANESRCNTGTPIKPRKGCSNTKRLNTVAFEIIPHGGRKATGP